MQRAHSGLEGERVPSICGHQKEIVGTRERVAAEAITEMSRNPGHRLKRLTDKWTLSGS